MNDYNTVTSEQAATYRESDETFARWAQGYGVIRHNDETQLRVQQLVRSLGNRSAAGDAVEVYELLMALDRLASAGLWLVVHQT